MSGQKQHNTGKYGICLLLFLLASCVVLMTGITLGRYQQDVMKPDDYKFLAQADYQLALGGLVTDTWLDSGTWPPVSEWVEQEEGTGICLDFSVRNGNSETEYAQRDQVYTVCLLVGPELEDTDLLTVTLTWEKDENTVELVGTPREIPEGSVTHSSFGDGWIYEFFVGEELRKETVFSMEGGKLRYQNYKLILDGGTQPVLTKLEINGEFSE